MPLEGLVCEPSAYVPNVMLNAATALLAHDQFHLNVANGYTLKSDMSIHPAADSSSMPIGLAAACISRPLASGLHCLDSCN